MGEARKIRGATVEAVVTALSENYIYKNMEARNKMEGKEEEKIFPLRY
jgi:hypothetical protein